MSDLRKLILIIFVLLISGVVLPVTADDDPANDFVNIVEAYLQLWISGEPSDLAEVMSEDFVRHQYGQKDLNYKQVYIFMGNMRNCEYKLVYEVKEAHVSGNLAWLTISSNTCINPDEIRDYPALVRFEDGKIVELWQAENPLQILELLGLEQSEEGLTWNTGDDSGE